jgi:hypothetical protein
LLSITSLTVWLLVFVIHFLQFHLLLSWQSFQALAELREGSVHKEMLPALSHRQQL